MQAPKPKKAKKTKQQLEEERKQAEEAARLAEAGLLVTPLLAHSITLFTLSIIAVHIHYLKHCAIAYSSPDTSAERLRLEAEEQARRAAEEEKRQALIQLQQEREDARLAGERYEWPK